MKMEKNDNRAKDGWANVILLLKGAYVTKILWVPQVCWCPSLSDGHQHRAGSPICGGRGKTGQGARRPL